MANLSFKLIGTIIFMVLHTTYASNLNKALKTMKYPEDYSRVVQEMNSILSSDSHRIKRSTSDEYFIEILVVVDDTMTNYYEEDLTKYLNWVFHFASAIYKHGLGKEINFAVSKAHKVNTTFAYTKIAGDVYHAGNILYEFCDWQKLKREQNSSLNYDVALFITRNKFCDEGNCKIQGRARRLQGMCKPDSSCAIIRDSDFLPPSTVAHEIGHLLGMDHDNELPCQRMFGLDTSSVMVNSSGKNAMQWSQCSRYAVNKFLKSGQGECLLNRPTEDNELLENSVEWIKKNQLSFDQQCQVEGKDYSEYVPWRSCKKAVCVNHMYSYELPKIMDYTPCGSDKVCYAGECINYESTEPVDGNWGEWGSFGECSRSCDGGIRNKTRECNNPLPKFGGKYCEGEGIEYDVCNTEKCPSDAPNFRKNQSEPIPIEDN